jgi:hypothetical protein
MAKWNTPAFIMAFIHDKLGRKRVHGSYRVLEGDHCKVLVKASYEWGRPAGNSLIGIRLDSDDLNLFFFHNYNTKHFTYSMNSEMDVYNAPKLPKKVLRADDTNLLSSGVVDVQEKEVLLEIGDKPYLLYRALTTTGAVTSGWGRIPEVATFSAINTVPKRVATVAEAKELVKDPVGMVDLCTKWWVEPMPPRFKPPGLEDTHQRALRTTINALDHGYELEDCNVTDTSYGATSVGVLVPKAKLLEEPLDSRAKSYIRAKKVWVDACEVMQGRTPVEYKGVTSAKSQYLYHSSTNERVGWIVKTTQGVFLKGKFSSKDNWEDQKTLTSWHKMYAPINRIKLG